jgi:hypothetical protein
MGPCGGLLSVFFYLHGEIKPKSPGTHNGEATICRSNGALQVLHPRNLLFPAWLPGTVEHFTPAPIAGQSVVSGSVGSCFEEMKKLRAWAKKYKKDRVSGLGGCGALPRNGDW